MASRAPAPSSSMSAVACASPAFSGGSAALPYGTTTAMLTSGSAWRSMSQSLEPSGPSSTSGTGGMNGVGAGTAGRAPKRSAAALLVEPEGAGATLATGALAVSIGLLVMHDPSAPALATSVAAQVIVLPVRALTSDLLACPPS